MHMSKPEPEPEPAVPTLPMSPQSGWRLFVEALGKVNFAVDGAAAIAVGMVIAAVSPTSTVALSLVVAGGMLLGVLLLALLIALLRSIGETARLWGELNQFRVESKRELDRQREEFTQQLQKLAELRPTRVVKAVVPSYLPYPPCSCVLIVAWSSTAALAVNTGVAISIAEETHERPLGFGTVRHIQEDGHAVITLDAPHSTTREHVTKLLTTPELLSKLRVGVQVSLQHLETTRSPVTPSMSPEMVGPEGRS